MRQPEPIDALNRRRLELMRLALRHLENIRAKAAHDCHTLSSLVDALSEPRGIAKTHAEKFKDYVRSIVKAELGGAS